MLDVFRGSVGHSPPGDRRMQSVLRSRFFFADIAFPKIEFSYSFNALLPYSLVRRTTKNH